MSDIIIGILLVISVFLYGLVLCEGLQLDGWFSDHGNGLDEFGVSR